MQRLDPPGVGARSLKECLLLQLTPGLLFYEELQVLIEHHLEDLENNRLPLISKKTGFSIETIQEAWEDLRTLKPKPGADFAETSAPAVTPDVFVEKDEDGKYEVHLEDGDLPSLYISPYYRKLLQDPATTAETRDYIKRKINSAQWLIEAIEQRRSTLTRVSQAIVDHQTRVPGRRPRAHRAAQDAADRRQGGRPRHHRQPGGRRQVDSDAPRHLSAQAVLRRRHHRRRRRGSGLGPRAAQAAGDHRRRGQDQAAVATTPWSRSWARPASRSPAARSPSTARR